MANMYEVLADAQNGEAITELGREFGLSSQQTQAAVAALLPAISMGIKRTTATPEGLGDLFALMELSPIFTRCMTIRSLRSPEKDGLPAMRHYLGCLARPMRVAPSPTTHNKCPASVRQF